MKPQKIAVRTAPLILFLIVAHALSHSQSVLFESSKAIEMEQSGVVNIMGTLAFRDSSLTVTIDDQLVNVGYFSYLRISADVFVPSDRTVLLSDGIKMGQILYLECTGGAWQLFDNQTLNHVNTSGTRNFAEGDTIQLIWNGTTWLENHFSDN